MTSIKYAIIDSDLQLIESVVVGEKPPVPHKVIPSHSYFTMPLDEVPMWLISKSGIQL